jgi:hypothetical protein
MRACPDSQVPPGLHCTDPLLQGSAVKTRSAGALKPDARRPDGACVIVRRAEPAGGRSRPRPRPIVLPTVNLLVRLWLPAPSSGSPLGLSVGRPSAQDGVPSRVEDVVPAGAAAPVRWLVAAPRYRGDLIEPEPDAGCLMSWVTEAGRWVVPVRRECGTRSLSREGVPIRSWWLAMAGPARPDQRRRFYRAGCALPVEVDVLADPFPTVLGRAIDLSEGGLRGVLPITGLDAGTQVIVRLPLDGVRTVLDGVVQRSRRPSHRAAVAGWHSEVVVAFDDPDRHGDLLRRTVIRMQLRARRLAPPGSR